MVAAAMRSSGAGLEGAEEALREAGLWSEAGLLASSGLLAWAEARAVHVLTPVCLGYPVGWARMPGLGPPAVWIRGDASVLLAGSTSLADAHSGRQLIGVVGSRSISGAVATFALRVGEEAARLGHPVISGGAEGCDTFGVRGALRAGGTAIQVLPFGLESSSLGGSASSCSVSTSYRGASSMAASVCDLSVCAPDEPFSTGTAMERNALIYAAASVTVVAHSRFRQGGTWHGATDALRRRLGRIAIREDSSSPAHQALIALGAVPITHPGEVSSHIDVLSHLATWPVPAFVAPTLPLSWG